MARKKSRSVRKYNPEKFRSDFVELASASPAEAANVAATWRERFANAESAARVATMQALEIGIAATTSFGMSWLDGGWEANKAKLIAEWDGGGAAAAGVDPADSSPFVEGDESDPTKIFGIDRVLVGTLVLAGLAIFNVAGDDYTPFVRAAALGSAAYWAGSVGFKFGYEGAEDAIAKEDAAA